MVRMVGSLANRTFQLRPRHLPGAGAAGGPAERRLRPTLRRRRGRPLRGGAGRPRAGAVPDAGPPYAAGPAAPGIAVVIKL